MNKLKKLVSVALAGAMALAMSVSTFAAGITASEQKILDAAQVKAEELGVAGTAKYAEYVSQARSYLTANELTDAQADAMVNAVNAAAEKASKASNGVALTELSREALESLFNEVVADVQKAAAAVGITIEVGPSGTITVNAPTKDGSQTQISDNRGPIKQTGADLAADKVGAAVSVDTTATGMTTTVVLSVMFVGAVAVCGVVAKKKNLFSGVEA